MGKKEEEDKICCLGNALICCHRALMLQILVMGELGLKQRTLRKVAKESKYVWQGTMATLGMPRT